MSHTGLYKWLVLLASFGMQVGVSGIAYNSGVYFVIFKENVHGSDTSIALATSLNMSLSFGLGPIAGALTKRLGCRPVAITGTILATLGLVATAFVTESWHLNLTFGILTGCGLSLCYTPSAVIVPEYFLEYRLIAISLSATGLGIGQIIFPPMIQHFVYEYGWRGGIVIIAGLILHTVTFACLMRPISHSQSKSKNINAKPNCKGDSLSFKTWNIIDAFYFFLMKDLFFDLYLIHIFLFGLGMSVAFVHMGAYAISTGLTNDKASSLYFICGITSTIARPICGMLTYLASPLTLSLVAIGLYGVFLFVYPFCSRYMMFGCISSLIGLVFGLYGPLAIQLPLVIIGLANLAPAIGYICLANATGLLIGAPIADWLSHLCSYYPVVFFTAGSIMVISWLFLIPISCRRKVNVSDDIIQDPQSC